MDEDERQVQDLLDSAGDDWRRRAGTNTPIEIFARAFHSKQTRHRSTPRRMVLLVAAAAVIAVAGGATLAIYLLSPTDHSAVTAPNRSPDSSPSGGWPINSARLDPTSVTSTDSTGGCESPLTGLGRLEDLGVSVKFQSKGVKTSPTYEMIVTATNSFQPALGTLRIKSVGELYAVSNSSGNPVFRGQSGFLGLLPDPSEYRLTDQGQQAEVQYLPIIRDCTTNDLMPDGTHVSVLVIVQISVGDASFAPYATEAYTVQVEDHLVKLPGT